MERVVMSKMICSMILRISVLLLRIYREWPVRCNCMILPIDSLSLFELLGYASRHDNPITLLYSSTAHSQSHRRLHGT